MSCGGLAGVKDLQAVIAVQKHEVRMLQTELQREKDSHGFSVFLCLPLDCFFLFVRLPLSCAYEVVDLSRQRSFHVA